LKALILTYYFPPAGGSGVQRWLKFTKYLQNFGIEPIIYTADNPNYPIIDKTLEKELPKNITILKQPIFEPNNFLKNNKKKSAGFLSENPSLTEKLTQYIRANFFIPDARKFWIKPSINYLSKYLKDNPVDIIISTGPPHSVHLIGLELKNRFNIPWIADFRDPWTNIDYFHKLPLTKKAKNKHFVLEKKVLINANVVLVVGKSMQKDYKKINNNTIVIENGYDDFQTNLIVEKDKKFSILHIGLLNQDRNHSLFWEALKEIKSEIPDFKNDLEIKLIGKVCNEALQEIEKNNLAENLTLIDYVPHQEVSKHQKESQVLLLFVNNTPNAKGIVTGKIFEYLQAKRPILAIGPTNGDLAEIIKKTQSGIVTNFGEKEKIKKTLLAYYLKYKNNSLHICPKEIDKYHRKELTKNLASVIKRTILKK
jgi:glycosyltransferase involved in cell wall biosynthesis